MDRFSKVDKAVDRFGYWIGAYTIMTGVFSWIAKQMDAYALGWPEAFFIGLFSAGFVVLIVSAGLIGWRFFNPLSPPIGNSSEPVAERRLSEDSMAGMIDARFEEFLATKLRAEFITHTQAHAQDEKLSDIAGKAKVAREIAEAGHADMVKRLDRVSESVRLLNHDFETWSYQHTEGNRQKFENIDEAFAALHNREWHERLFGDLEAAFEDIAAPIDKGNGLDDGDSWLRSIQQWKGKLDQWLIIAEYYANGTADKVQQLPDHLYDGEWAFDEATITPNQVHRFKEVAIWWHNAKEEKKRVDKQLALRIFHSPSMKGDGAAPPRLGEDQ
ncbi:hypothetical protein GCM10023208_16970 [Erythrobacter westpacificensis]|uniref:Uncharacterized protein n=1 Tax=Erythrobacter westpacificensis TaxID=1055231 RepID=A0ABP9KD91_9SPHN